MVPPWIEDIGLFPVHNHILIGTDSFLLIGVSHSKPNKLMFFVLPDDLRFFVFHIPLLFLLSLYLIMIIKGLPYLGALKE
jgi:hypothetical protein